MDLVRKIIRAEAAFPRSFANAEDRPWGVMYHNVDIADSHDSNHAWMFGGDPDAVVAEMEGFYCQKGLTPRVHRMSVAGETDRCRATLQRRGFTFGPHAARLFVHKSASRVQGSAGVEVRRAGEADGSLLGMVERSSGPRMRKVIERRVRASGYHLLVGYLGGQAVTMGSLESIGELARVDDVLTDVHHRGRGFGRALTEALVRYHAEHMGNTLYLYADHPTAIRMYIEAGFEEIRAAPVTYSAWKEAQGGQDTTPSCRSGAERRERSDSGRG
jgi:ribosomal protein S18 acetylase RimI-like enzyme